MNSLSQVWNPAGKRAFLRHCKPGDAILDVGCGNDSPRRIKAQIPFVHYTGLDIHGAVSSAPPEADCYVSVARTEFAHALQWKNKFDCVVSSHNLEHCDTRWEVLHAMCQTLKHGGRLYLSFPSAESVSFPSRKGTLNYLDDPTHQSTPPDFDTVLEILRQEGFTIEKAIRNNRPLLPRILGLLQEPFLAYKKIATPGTWALYGFESIVWAYKA